MTSRSITSSAVTAIALLTLLDVALLGSLTDRGRFWYYVIVRTGLFALVAASAAVAARRFRWWGDYMGRAWTLLFAAYTLLVASEVVRRFLPEVSFARELLLIVANVAIIGAYWLFARSFRSAGLRYSGRTAAKNAIIGLAAVVAIALVGGSAVTAAQSLWSQQPHPGQLVSALADLITFLLAAPLLLTAYSFRGGHLFWTFALLTAGTFGWMFNQGSSRLFGLLGYQDAIAAGRNFGFAMACCLIAAAALAQWLGAYRDGAVNEVQHA